MGEDQVLNDILDYSKIEAGKLVLETDNVSLRFFVNEVVTLLAAGVATQGEPVLARYNAPFTPWFLRRNEIWLALR